jgi:glycosyltransferase involved in cell wall biosynthesis
MKACDLFIFPSRIEGMPNVLKEAGAAGIPIIASCIGGIPELLGEDERGLLMPEISTESLIDCIQKSKNFPDKAKERCINMKEYIDKTYSVEVCTEQLIEIYKYILNNN